mmetsp:Transcript_7657/g.20875  ORF Transcript_7657/g.20875 Transcript_7657/m.20875 type:complete len:353 (-) Transcript_7657:16-1074(-)
MFGKKHAEEGASSQTSSITTTESPSEKSSSTSKSTSKAASQQSLIIKTDSSSESMSASCSTSPKHSMDCFANPLGIPSSRAVSVGNPPASTCNHRVAMLALLRASSDLSWGLGFVVTRILACWECAVSAQQPLWATGKKHSSGLRSRCQLSVLPVADVDDETLQNGTCPPSSSSSSPTDQYREPPSQSSGPNFTTSSCSPTKHPALLSIFKGACELPPIQGIVPPEGSAGAGTPSEATSEAISHPSLVGCECSPLTSATCASLKTCVSSVHCRLTFVDRSLNSATSVRQRASIKPWRATSHFPTTSGTHIPPAVPSTMTATSIGRGRGSRLSTFGSDCDAERSCEADGCGKC